MIQILNRIRSHDPGFQADFYLEDTETGNKLGYVTTAKENIIFFLITPLNL